MRLNHLNLCARNLERTWAFYREVLGATYSYHLAPNKIVAKLGDFDLFLEQVSDWRPYHSSYHIGFVTSGDEVAAWATRLQQRGIDLVRGNNPSAELFRDPTCNRVALYFKDPDDLMIEIYSPD
ncbi:MAG: VOC family protein [Rhodospirillales bacterium]|nr:VOC family protein [Rhodospirillales bacterium]